MQRVLSFPWKARRRQLPAGGERRRREHSSLNALAAVVAFHVVARRLPDLPLLQKLPSGRDVRAHVAILVPGGGHAPHHLVHLLQRLGRLQRAQELDCLTGGEQLDGDHLLNVPHHLEAFPCRKAAHGDVVLGAGAGREGVDAGRVAEGLVLRDERGGRAVGDHEAGVEAAVLHQEGRQLAVDGIWF